MLGIIGGVMARAFEIARDIEVDATPNRSGRRSPPGRGWIRGSWATPRSSPGKRGAVRWSIGDFTIGSTVTAWDPPNRFVSAGSPMPDGTFHQFDYAVEPREGGSAVRFVHSGALGQDDWEAEYEAMSEGDPMYLFKLVQYLKHFKGPSRSRSTSPARKLRTTRPRWPRSGARSASPTMSRSATA